MNGVPHVVDESANVIRAVRRASKASLRSAAGHVRGIARKSIASPPKQIKPPKLKKDGTPRKSKPGTWTIPSKPGGPPRSPTRRLKEAIRYEVDASAGDAVVGPTSSVFGRIGQSHEFGGREGSKGGGRGRPPSGPRSYPARPFMGPALARSREKLPTFWRNALKGS